MKIKRPLHTPLGIRDLEYKASIKNRYMEIGLLISSLHGKYIVVK